MDHHDFDALVRRLRAPLSRRTTLGAGLAALLPAALAAPVAVAAGKKRKKCGECERRKGRRKCKPKPDNATCKNGGLCRKGRCNKPPTCTGAAQDCLVDSDCCSGQCSDTNFCLLGSPGQRCRTDFDCGGGPANNFRFRCIGYVCEDTQS